MNKNPQWKSFLFSGCELCKSFHRDILTQAEAYDAQLKEYRLEIDALKAKYSTLKDEYDFVVKELGKKELQGLGQDVAI